MIQKEKYKRAASAMRNALVSIMSDTPDTEYRMRAARDEIQAALPYEDSDYWRVDAPAEGIAETEEKKECAELTQEKYKKGRSGDEQGAAEYLQRRRRRGRHAAQGGCGNSGGTAER